MISIKPVINCSGKMTYLGSSVLSDEVICAMNDGAKSFYDMKDLNQKASDYIGKLSGADGAFITPGASSAIAACVASLITKDNRSMVENIPFTNNPCNKVILQKGHSIHFGAKITQMIAMGGGKALEVGTVNKCEPYQISDAIDDDVCAILYVKSHHAQQDGMVSLEDIIKIAKEKNIAVIVDAAAEENLKTYLSKGADLVVYSGAKAFSGPTSGCIVGNKPYIDWCKLQSVGIMRAMKVGKETIFGLLKAIELQAKSTRSIDEQKQILSNLENYLNGVSNLSTKLVFDSVGREIVRLRLFVGNDFKMNANDLSVWLKSQEPAIYTRDHHRENGYIEFDPRVMKDSDGEEIIKRVKELIRGDKHE
ncbi:MAG: DgaE family pyridoxal phosphate-dependent ammonia lyase [Anaerorhabdus sp.]